MRTRSLWTLSILSVVALAAAHPRFQGALPRGPHEAKILQSFDTMYGVDGPFVGDGFPIRGIPGDELPWEIQAATGSLDADGHLTIRVKGLVFKDEPEVPPDLRGKNDEAQFRGAVSCWSEEGDQVTTVNVVTAGFPATVSGNSTIRATVSLPNPCVAPIILVLAGSEDKWFAVAGVETEEDED
jgi:hypothetical protein